MTGSCLAANDAGSHEKANPTAIAIEQEETVAHQGIASGKLAQMKVAILTSP